MKKLISLLSFFLSAHAYAQITIVNLTQPDSNSRLLYTCRKNLLKIPDLPRGATLKEMKWYVEKVGNYVTVNSPEHNDGDTDTLEFIDGTGMQIQRVVFTYVTCIANSKSQVDPFDKKVFIAGKTNKGILQPGYRQYSVKVTLADLRSNPKVTISDSAYEISRIRLQVACKRCDEIISEELKSGDLSTCSQFSTLRKRDKIFLDDIQCTKRMDHKKTIDLASIVINVE